MSNPRSEHTDTAQSFNILTHILLREFSTPSIIQWQSEPSSESNIGGRGSVFTDWPNDEIPPSTFQGHKTPSPPSLFRGSESPNSRKEEGHKHVHKHYLWAILKFPQKSKYHFLISIILRKLLPISLTNMKSTIQLPLDRHPCGLSPVISVVSSLEQVSPFNWHLEGPHMWVKEKNSSEGLSLGGNPKMKNSSQDDPLPQGRESNDVLTT